MSEKALLIIDMLHDFLDEGAPLEVPDGRNIISSILKILNYGRSNNWNVFYLCDNHRETDSEFKIWPAHCIKGTRGAEVIEDLEPNLERGEVIIPKRRYSGFYGTDLDLWLREFEVKTLILVGILTNICILYSSADASQRVYKVIIMKDGVAALSSEDNQWALKQMEVIHGAKILTEKEIEKEFK